MYLSLVQYIHAHRRPPPPSAAHVCDNICTLSPLARAFHVFAFCTHTHASIAPPVAIAKCVPFDPHVAAGSGGTPESETLSRFEVMDGCPVRGELIPLRLYLGGIDELTPTYSNIANAFTVRYFVNLVLVDEEDRRYFKQQEITLWRNALKA